MVLRGISVLIGTRSATRAALPFLVVLAILLSISETAAQTTIWSENFNSYANGTASGTGSGFAPAGWTTTPSGKVWVQGGRIQATNLGTESIWRTSAINVRGFTGVTFRLDVATQADLSQFEAGSDYFVGEYRLNGSGIWTEFENASGDSSPWDPLQSSYTVNVAGTPSTLEIRVRFFNSANNEYYFIDNISVSGTAPTCPGEVNFEFYDGVPSGSTVDNIPTTGALATGQFSSFDVDALQGQSDPGDTDSFGIRYRGYIEILAAGSYTFYTSSDDGSKLYINGATVVNNDGNHGTVEASGSITLPVGYHNIEVRFFENGGSETLTVQYQGPSIAKQNIPFTRLSSVCSTATDTTDTDGDGVYDTVDIDDDNDGILDTDECGNITGGEVQTATSLSYFTQPANAEGIPGITYARNPTTWPGGSSVLLLRFPSSLPVGTEVVVFLGADPAVSDSDMQIQRSTAGGGNNGYLADGNNITPGAIRRVEFTVSGSSLQYIRVEAWNQGARVYGASYNGGSTCYSLDTDNDGVFNHHDLDADGDGIPDNIEAQSTTGYTAPSGSDSDGDGLDNSYESGGLPTPDTDSDGTPDIMDTDSDGDGTIDTQETWFTLTGSDSDGDGLDNATDATTGYADPGGNIDNPLNTGGGSQVLPDWDSDATTGGDVDYRDDTDDSGSAAPVVTATGDQLYCPLTSIPIAESISITDADDTSTDMVFVQISTGYVNGEDLLTLTGTHPNITPSWDATEGKLTLQGPALYTEFEAAILDIEYSSSAASPSGTRQFSITAGTANFLPATSHYYEYIPSLGITWTNANTAANARTYFGLQGYLATLTSQVEADFSGSQAAGTGWIGGSDAAVEGVWRWVTGPEAGLNFWNGTAGGSSPNFAFWNTAEPNQSGDEDYAHITHPNVNPNGSWNDLSNAGAGSGDYQPQGYVVEYGGMPGDPTLNITDVTTITIDNVDPTASNPAPLTVYCPADVPAANGSVVTDEADNCAPAPVVSFVNDVSNGGSNPEIITRTYRVTDAAGNSVDVQQTITVYTLSISGQPANQLVFAGNNGTFSVTGVHTDTYQWQVSTNGGGLYSNISDGAEYSGTQTATLTVIQPGTGKNGNLFRVLLSRAGSGCGNLTSNGAELEIRIGTTISNRRITYRVNPSNP